MNFSSIFGRIVPNFFADHFGVLNTFIICVGINGIAYYFHIYQSRHSWHRYPGIVGFLMLLADHNAGIIVFSIL